MLYTPYNHRAQCYARAGESPALGDRYDRYLDRYVRYTAVGALRARPVCDYVFMCGMR